MDKQKRVLTVQDISCFGKCSNTVMMPILSQAGAEAVMLPTALLSTHTGGFPGFTFLDLTEEMKKILAHWQSLDLHFDMLCTGYFGSAEQLLLVKSAVPALLEKDALRLIDPVLGDGGRLYPMYNGDYVEKMRSLCRMADLITPNMTEAALLADIPYAGEEYSPNLCLSLFEKLHAAGPSAVLLTGVRFPHGRIGVVGHKIGGEMWNAHSPLLDCTMHGTGDVLTGALAAYLLQGCDFEDAARRAEHFVAACIKTTTPVIREHWYGLLFEPCLPQIRIRAVE